VTNGQSAAVIRLQPGDRARAGEVLARAFSDDPLWAAVFTNPAERSETLVHMFAGVTKATIAAKGLAETTPDIAAVGLWLPPGKDIGMWAMVRSGFALPRLVMRLPSQERRRMMAVLRQVEERRKALMPEPHWYLSALGVEPERQGTGLGSALVRSGIRRADLEKTPIYLETETEDNVAFYEHLGFETVEAITAVGLDLPVWLMARRPPTASA
jgi:ribosomal protein S18 acetylase RimI-like enzyme